MSALGDLVGVELGPTGWIDVTQERIDAFAAATPNVEEAHGESLRPVAATRRVEGRGRGIA